MNASTSSIFRLNNLPLIATFEDWTLKYKLIRLSKISKLFAPFKIWLHSRYLYISFLNKQCFWIDYFAFSNYFQVLCLVSGDYLCYGPNTFSLSLCQTNCIREMTKTNLPKRLSIFICFGISSFYKFLCKTLWYIEATF